MLDLCLGSISFLDKAKQKIITSSHIIGPLPKKELAPSEKVTPSKEVGKGTKMLNYIEDIVVTIRRKNLDNFQGKSTGSTCWFIFDRWWLKETLSELEPYFYKNLLKSNI